MLLHDDTLTGADQAWIRERHYNAEWALTAQLEVLARQFDEIEDEYLRERKADLEQVVERVLGARARRRGARRAGDRRARHRGEDPLVLVAHDISPADMLQFKRQRLHRLRHRRRRHAPRTPRSSRAAWTFRRSSARARRAALIRQDDWVIIDGDAGVVIVDPRRAVLAEYRVPAAPARPRARRRSRACATRRR